MVAVVGVLGRESLSFRNKKKRFVKNLFFLFMRLCV